MPIRAVTVKSLPAKALPFQVTISASPPAASVTDSSPYVPKNTADPVAPFVRNRYSSTTGGVS